MKSNIGIYKEKGLYNILLTLMPSFECSIPQPADPILTIEVKSRKSESLVLSTSPSVSLPWYPHDSILFKSFILFIKWDSSAPPKSGRTAPNPRSQTPSSHTIVLNLYRPFRSSPRNTKLTVSVRRRSRRTSTSLYRSCLEMRHSREILWGIWGMRRVRGRWLGVITLEV